MIDWTDLVKKKKGGRLEKIGERELAFMAPGLANYKKTQRTAYARMSIFLEITLMIMTRL